MQILMSSSLRLLFVVVLATIVACDSTDSQDDFVQAASSPPSGITRTDASGQVTSEDTDDWRTSPFFVGKVFVDPAYPNPAQVGSTITVQIRVLQFGDISGRLVLRAEVGDDLVPLDELIDTSSPGAYIMQFSGAQLGRTGLHRLYIFDEFGEIVSYGDLLIEEG